MHSKSTIPETPVESASTSRAGNGRVWSNSNAAKLTTMWSPANAATVRATFTGNLVFHETVTDWAEPRLLSFRIAAQTDSIPPTTLDRHVTIGGQYFDVLQGTYVLEPLAGGTRLRLTSKLRVSTHFNVYSGPWADTIMKSIQETILAVEKKRAES